MTKIDVFSGFLGAGKTTLIKKLIDEAYRGENLVLIENEFGEVGIDGGFLKDTGIEITEMNSGCICCSLVGDFGEALKKVITQYNPDRILIEPSGVGKLSDVISAIKHIDSDKIVLNGFSTVVDANKCKMYMKNFGEFFNNQIENAGTIILSHTDDISEEKLSKCIGLLRTHNTDATIISTPWSQIDGISILNAIENKNTLKSELEKLEHNVHHHEHNEHCDCHEHHYEHDEHCNCGHKHHHADEVFTSWGKETTNKYTTQQLTDALKQLDNDKTYGFILRAKGILPATDGSWIYFDYIPGEVNVRKGNAEIIGRICVIGSKINESAIEDLFNI